MGAWADWFTQNMECDSAGCVACNGKAFALEQNWVGFAAMHEVKRPEKT